MTGSRAGRLLALGAACATAIAGCGGSASSSGPRSGRAVFAYDCAVCHSLSGHESARLDGGDLLRVHATPTELLEFAREMRVRHRLDAAQLRAVVEYVYEVERRGRPVR